MIGERTAEEVKIQIGTALPLERELQMEVRGRDLIAGLPRTIPITSSEVMEAIEAPLQQLVAAVRLGPRADAARSFSSDIIDKGMVMSGGGALLRNIDKLLTQVTGVPCHVAENSLNCVALGHGPRPGALRLLQEVARLSRSRARAPSARMPVDRRTDDPTATPRARACRSCDLHCHTSGQLRLAGRRRRRWSGPPRRAG